MKNKKKEKKLKVEHKRLVKWLRVIIVLCIAIIVVEVGYIGLSYYNRKNSIVYTDTLNSFKKIDDGYLVVGNSDFKNYEEGYNKAKFAKYNDDFEVEFESAYTKGYLSYFSDVIEYSDGYIAVGGAQYDEQQVEDNATDGLIVLYDKNGKQVDTKSVQIVGDTTFNKVLLVDDGFIVVGQSILQNMVVGEKWEVWIPYQLAYGTSDRKDSAGNVSIPAYSTLVFEIEVMERTAEAAGTTDSQT